MQDERIYHRFAVTMTGALLIFLGAAILANTGRVTVFVVRLVGFACALSALTIFAGHLMRAHALDAVPFEELLAAGGLLLVGTVVALFPGTFAKALFSVLGVLIVLSGLRDILRTRTMVADDDQRERAALRIGIVTVAIGLFVTFVPTAAVHGVPLICGCALVLDGLSELYLALRMDSWE